MSKERRRKGQELPQQLFITVLYGNDEEELFNPHCRSLILLECMREKSETEKDVKLDLMDEKGLLTNVFENVSFKDYASTILKGRKKYFLIRILPQDDEDPETGEVSVKYEAVLRSIEKRYPHLAERLRKLSDQSAKKGRAKKLLKKQKNPVKMRISKLRSPRSGESSDNIGA